MRSADRIVMLCAILIATLWTAGCATAPVPQRDLPPLALLEPCEEPVAVLDTNDALVKYTLALRTALRLCNNDKESLRDWAKEDHEQN